MAVTYPVTPPAVFRTASASWTARSTVAINTSTFTGQQQVLANQGEWWEVSLSVPAVASRADADALDAFLLSLRGRYGTFRYGDKLRTTPRGTITGTRTVTSFGVGSTTLQIASGTGAFVVGDFLMIGNQLFRVAVVNSATSYEVFPRARRTYSSGSPITYTSPTGIFRLKDDPVITLGNGKVFGPYTFTLIEAVTST